MDFEKNFQIWFFLINEQIELRRENSNLIFCLKNKMDFEKSFQIWFFSLEKEWIIKIVSKSDFLIKEHNELPRENSNMIF